MKKITLLGYLSMALLLFFTSCNQEDGDIILKSKDFNTTNLSKSQIQAISCGETTVVDLIAGQHINVGTVTVSNDETYLYVTYETTGDWYLTDTHLYVGAESDIPYTKPGNPKFGHFPYSDPHGTTQSYTYKVDLSTLDDTFAVIAHGVVDKIVNGETVISEETAFGCGDKEFPGKRWGCYFDYTKQECDDDECLDIFGIKHLPQYRSCMDLNINGNTMLGWSSRLKYKWLLDMAAINHYEELPIYINSNGCDLSEVTEIGRMEVTAGDNGTGVQVAYFIYPYDYSDYEIYEIDLYVGTEENPYNTDGTLKDNISEDNFHRQTFDTPVKRTDPVVLPWTGDERSELYIIPYAKVCKIK